jgi:hypothetical protein
MCQRYAIAVPAATGARMAPFLQVIETTGIFCILSDGYDANLASNAYMPFEKRAP